ncbi:MAG: hypothetical protein GEU80_13435 [Dehalococcoidia bacterium]|nr:hypothetical protein [Dehalococcoidia bacterium]
MSPRTRRYYQAGMTAAERRDFQEAAELEGIREEVALLRMLVRRALRETPEDTKAIHGGLRLLVQTLLAERRLSPPEAEGLSGAMARVIEELGDIWQAPAIGVSGAGEGREDA